jgi:hypothetical protein
MRGFRARKETKVMNKVQYLNQAHSIDVAFATIGLVLFVVIALLLGQILGTAGMQMEKESLGESHDNPIGLTARQIRVLYRNLIWLTLNASCWIYTYEGYFFELVSSTISIGGVLIYALRLGVLLSIPKKNGTVEKKGASKDKRPEISFLITSFTPNRNLNQTKYLMRVKSGGFFC